MPVPTTAPSTAPAISDSARWAVTRTYSYTRVWSSCNSHLLLIVSAHLSISMPYFILLSFCKHQYILICMSFCLSVCVCVCVAVCLFACLFAVSLPHSQYLIVLSLYIGWSIHFLFNTHSSLLVHVNIFTHLSLPVYQSVAVLHRVLWIWLF